MIIYGIPVATMDYDVYLDGEEENTCKFLKIAREFDFYPSKKEEDLKKHFMFQLENDIIIDVFRARKITNKDGELIDFKEIYERRETFEDVGGVKINVPSVPDLIKLKKTGREKDVHDVRYLEKIKDDIPVKRQRKDVRI